RTGTTPYQGSTVSTYSQGSRVEFTGKRGEDEPTMFMVRFESLFRSMELEDTFCRTVPIKVGMLSREELYGQFQRREVDASYKAWNLLLNSVVDVAMMVRITAEGSPSGGWSAFKNYYTPQADAEKERVRQEWYDLRQGMNEAPQQFFSRATVLESKLCRHGILMEERETNTHVIRRLSSLFHTQAEILRQ
ncbi:unnamed protein product, partial [Pylaiella littoralis]